MSQPILLSSTAHPLLFFMTDSADHISGKTGLSPTVTISKSGGAFGSPAGAVSEIANGWYKVAGNATDSGTLGEIALHATGTGADPFDGVVGVVVSFNPQDAVRMGLTALPNAAAEAAGGLYTRGTGAGQINQPANGMIDTNPVRLGGVAQSLTDLKDFADTGYDPAAHKVTGVVLVDTLTTYTGNTVQTGDSFARIGATGSGLTSLASQASVNTLDDFVDTEVAAILADTDDIQTRLPAALVGGRIDASVGAMASNVMTAAALAADAVAEIQTGLATPTNITAGVITTVTNLTNAPTAGDFTATMKTSITTAATSATPTVTLAAAAVQAIWDAATSALTTAGSIGKKLADWALGSDSRVLVSANAHTSGETVANMTDKTGMAVGSGGIAASSFANNSMTAAAMASDMVDEIWAKVVETAGSYTAQQAMSLVLAVLAGQSTGGGLTFKTPNGASTRVVATVDVSQNRTGITATPSA